MDTCEPGFNDNLTNVLLAGTAVLPVLPLAKFSFDILVLRKNPYCILLLSLMPVDAPQKKDYEIQLIGSWNLGILFLKVLLAGHNAGLVIINHSILFSSIFSLHVFRWMWWESMHCCQVSQNVVICRCLGRNVLCSKLPTLIVL